MDYNVIVHGIDAPDYFPGCGCGTYDTAVTGVGENTEEAANDAIDQIAHNADMDQALAESITQVAIKQLDLSTDIEDMYVYVSIQYSL